MPNDTFVTLIRVTDVAVVINPTLCPVIQTTNAHRSTRNLYHREKQFMKSEAFRRETGFYAPLRTFPVERAVACISFQWNTPVAYLHRCRQQRRLELENKYFDELGNLFITVQVAILNKNFTFFFLLNFTFFNRILSTYFLQTQDFALIR